MASVRVHPLLCGEMLAPPGFLARPAGPLGQLRGMGLHVPRSRWTWVPIPAFLIEHPDHGSLLVDTGFDVSVARDPGETLGRAAKLLFTYRMRPEQAVPTQLRERGIDPADVRTVVMTHLHTDHIGGGRALGHATFLVHRDEHAYASSHGLTDGYRAELLDGLDWRLLDGETDVLGDGSVRLVPTPGHSPGHMSVLVRLEGRDLLLCGDALYAAAHLHSDALPLFVWDGDRYRDSLRTLRALVAERGEDGVVVVAGHDAEAWPSLPAVIA